MGCFFFLKKALPASTSSNITLALSSAGLEALLLLLLLLHVRFG